MDNLEKLSEAIAALDEATNQKENVRLKTSNEEKNLEDILNEVKAISKREQTTKKRTYWEFQKLLRKRKVSCTPSEIRMPVLLIYTKKSKMSCPPSWKNGRSLLV